MFIKYLLIFSLIALNNWVNSCQDPKIEVTSYTTQDATLLTQIAYIAEFTVNCQGNDRKINDDSNNSNSSKRGKNLYALMDKNYIIPVAVTSENHYQISWTEDVKTAKIGDIPIRIFDEYGYIMLRKALRTGDDLQHILPFATITINHPGIYRGPWISCEFLAVSFSLIISYYAIAFRNKLLS